MSDLLSADALRRCLTLVWQGGKEMVRVGDQLRDHIAALADNAEILRGVQEMRNLLMYPHDEWHQVAADAIRVGNGLTAVDHPGVALLEVVHAIRQYQRADEPDVAVTFRRLLQERDRIAHMVDPEQHRKALVRARNEGLEALAKDLLLRADVATEYGHIKIAEVWRNAASSARAMKEPE